jgi:hypothetical protein
MPCAPTSLKQPLFVDAYDGQFIQCVSPISFFYFIISSVFLLVFIKQILVIY